MWGYVADIETASSENTTTPFKMTIITRIAFLEEGEIDLSWHVCEIFAWTSNLMSVGPAVISLGDPVCGLIAASYGGYMAAVLETWKKVAMDDWARTCPYPPPNDLDSIDFNRWAVDALPELGGDGYYYEGPARLTSVRSAAPPLDPRLFFQARRERAKNATIDPNAVDPDESSPPPLKTT